MKRTALAAAAILVPFTVFSLWVVAGFGYTGFLALAAREPWALQMLLDLVIACSFATGWMFGDASKRGLPRPWPFLVTTIFLGSVGLLSYAIYRAIFARRAM
jgi:hypothetical protein